MSKRKSKKIPAIAVMSTLAVTALASSVSADTIIRNSTLNGLQVSSGASNANINAQGKITSISGDVVIKAPTTLKADSDATNPFKDAKVVIETNGTVTIEVPLKEVQINSNATIKLTPGKGSIERASVAPGKNPDLPPSVPGVGNAPNVSLSMETGKITKGKVKLVGTDSTMEYQIKAKGSDSWGTAWTSITGRDIELTASKDNVIRVRVKATTTTLASQARELTVRTENIGNPVVVDKAALKAKIKEAEELKEADYTSDSWSTLRTALTNAKTVAADTNATQTQVNAQVTALTTALNKLVKKDQVVNKAELNAKIKEAEELKEADYTSDSWSALQTALTAAKTVAADTNATEEQVNAQVTALTTALNKLVKKDQVVNKAELNAKIKEAEGLKEADYTSDSWSTLRTALTNAKNIAADTNATQTQVNAALEGLATAINNLVPNAPDVTNITYVLNTAGTTPYNGSVVVANVPASGMVKVYNVSGKNEIGSGTNKGSQAAAVTVSQLNILANTDYQISITLNGKESNKATKKSQAPAPAPAPALSVKVEKGSKDGMTKATVNVQGLSLKAQVTDTEPIVPNVGDVAPGAAYQSERDLQAKVGQWLAIYEVDSSGKVKKFYKKQLETEEIA